MLMIFTSALLAALVKASATPLASLLSSRYTSAAVKFLYEKSNRYFSMIRNKLAVLAVLYVFLCHTALLSYTVFSAVVSVVFSIYMFLKNIFLIKKIF